jgi:hypothetical protein
MTVLPDAVRAYEQELLQKADMLALALNGLKAAAPERAVELLDEIAVRLGRAVGRETAGVGVGTATHFGGQTGGDERGRAEPRRPAPIVVAARGGGADDIEDFILDILAENPAGLSVQDLVSNLDEAQLEIKRKTLVVRLHRMVHAGRLSSLAHGHYTLSEAERSRRRA